MTGLVLVAGGTGRLGTLVVTALAARGVAVRVITRDRHRADHLGGPLVETVLGDVRDPDGVAAAMTDVDVAVSAVHGFAGPGGGTPASVDRDGNRNLIEAARAVGADMVLMSVVGAAADSRLELFRMKHAAETALSASGVPATVVRSTAFLELWIELLRRTAGRSNRPLVFGRGTNPINFVSVRDVAALVGHVVTDPTTRGQTLQVGGPENLTFDELAGLVAAHGVADPAGPPRHGPRAALHAIAATVGRVRPELGRQVRAALVMDQDDLTFDAHEGRGLDSVPHRTSVSELFA
jgi:NADH dehydrogenase